MSRVATEEDVCDKLAEFIHDSIRKGRHLTSHAKARQLNPLSRRPQQSSADRPLRSPSSAALVTNANAREHEAMSIGVGAGRDNCERERRKLHALSRERKLERKRGNRATPTFNLPAYRQRESGETRCASFPTLRSLWPGLRWRPARHRRHRWLSRSGRVLSVQPIMEEPRTAADAA
jgi:hypothetical protein